MAKKSKNGKYLNLQDVRVSYDLKTDIFSVTAADSELKELGGLKLDVSHSSRAHSALKALMKRHGVIQGDPWPKLTSAQQVELFESNLNPRLVPIGTNLNGELQTWNIDEIPNLWIYGGAGSGTSVPKRSMLVHGLTHGWDIRALDVTGIELPKELSPKPSGHTLPHSEILKELESVERLMEDRFAELEGRGVNHHGGSFQTTLVVLDNIVPIFEDARADDPSAAVYRSVGRGIMRLLEKIGSWGKAADIHLVVGVRDDLNLKRHGFEDLMEEFIPAMGRVAGYLILGKLIDSSLPLAIRERYRPFRSYILGRAHLVNYGVQSELQSLYLFPEKLNELLSAR